MLAGGILYLDSFRLRLLEQRQSQLQAGAFLVAISIENDTAADLRRQIAAASVQTGTRIRIYGEEGRRVFDSWDLTGPT
ncbi:MAG TPA: hypothetical protein VFJ13_02780, partial [Paracoccaceae bacterium]|nr:hypothetical protein [Paracoccaceae bacterium]